MGTPLNPVKLVKTELVMFSVGAAFVPPTVIFPPLFENTRLLLFAHDAKGKASANKAVRTTRFMEILLEPVFPVVEGDVPFYFFFFYSDPHQRRGLQCISAAKYHFAGRYSGFKDLPSCSQAGDLLWVQRCAHKVKQLLVLPEGASWG